MKMQPAASPTANPPAAPRRRRRLLKVAAVLTVLLVALILITPTALSNSLVRDKLAREMSAQLGAAVTIEALSLGWFTGFGLEGLVIANPADFPSERDAVRLASVHGDVSLLSILRGRINLEATVNQLQVNVYQRANGRSNLEELFGVTEAAVAADDGGSHGKIEVRSESRIENLRLDLKLVDSEIEIRHETKGLLESLRRVNAAVHKEYGGSQLRSSFDAVLDRPDSEMPGRINLLADVDATMQRPATVKYDILGLDLARYRPLLSGFVAMDQVTAFAGIVNGNGQALVDLDGNRVQLEGTINVERPHFAGPLFSNLEIRESRWRIDPNLTIEIRDSGGLPRIDAEGLRIDLGFMTLSGLAAGAASALTAGKPALGVNFDVDIARLANMGGPVPPELRGAVGHAKGVVAMAIEQESFATDYLIEHFQELLAADVQIAIDRIAVADQDLTNIRSSLALRGDKSSLSANGMIAGGKAALGVKFDPTKTGVWPARIALSVDGAKLLSSSIPVMRYAIPLLAGTPGAGADLQGTANCRLELRGPLQSGAGEPVLEWLNRWSGRGNLAVVEGSLELGAELEPLLQFAGANKLSFRKLTTAFVIENGFIETSLLKFQRAAGDIGVTGKTGLDGSIDYRIDLASELARHRDGRRILAALGGKLPVAALTGSLDQPALQMPDLGEQVQNLLEGGAQDLLKKGLDQLFKKR